MINKVIFQGRLVKDIEVKDVGGFSLTEFTIAWSEKYKETETKCFLRCKAWRSTADFLGKYFRKGQELIVEGHMITEEWEQDGEKKNRTLCTVEKVNFCGSKSDNAGSAPAPAQTTSPDEFMTIPDGIDEELPFA